MSDVDENNEIGGAWTLPVLPDRPEALPRIADAEIIQRKSLMAGAAIILISDTPSELTALAISGDAPLILGSSADTDFALDHESVSAEHCEFIRDNDEYIVTNLALLQGTWVNEKRIRSHKLVNRDIIRSGRLEFMFLT